MKASGSALVALSLGTSLLAGAGEVQLVSRTPPGPFAATAAAASRLGPGPSVSDDGRYVVFLSAATNLVPEQDDTNGVEDLFLRDRVTGSTVLVSHAAGSPTRAAKAPAFVVPLNDVFVISADGRFVAFSSLATDLVEGQTGTAQEVFLFDRVTLGVTMVTHVAGGPTQGAGGGLPMALSDDGRFLALLSSSSKLLPGQDPLTSYSCVFLFDRVTETITLVSHAYGAPSTGARGSLTYRCLSGDGQRLVFESEAPNLVSGQTGNGTQAFLFDAPTNRVTLVSHTYASLSAGGTPGTISRGGAVISRDGSHVAYSMGSRDLVAGGPPFPSVNVYLYTVGTGSNRLVSHTPSSMVTSGDDDSPTCQVSRDGGTVVFSSYAIDLVSGVSTDLLKTYAYDSSTQKVSLVSRSQSGGGVVGLNEAVSLDGSKVAFTSSGTDLVPGQVGPGTSSLTDQAYLFDLRSGQMALVTHAPSSAVTASTSPVGGTALSGDGETVVLDSASDLSGAQDLNGLADVFAYDVRTGAASLVSRADGRPSRTPMGRSSLPLRGSFADASRPVLSGDGRHVLFTSDGANLVPNQTGDDRNLFTADRFTGQNRLVTHAPGDPLKGTTAAVFGASISADGRYVAYSTDAILADGAAPGLLSYHCYVWDRLTGLNGLLSNDCGDVVMSPDGRFLVYARTTSLYLLDRGTGINQLVNRRYGTTDTTASGFADDPQVSADGRWVTFTSNGTDLTAGGTTGTQLFLFDAQSGTNTLVSHRAGAPDQNGDADCLLAAITPDGSYVAYTSTSRDLVSGQVDQAGTYDVFLYDRATGLNELVSHADSLALTAAGDQNARGGRPILSDDGRFVAFALNGGLVSGPNNTSFDTVYLFDRLAGTNSLVSHVPGLPTSSAGATQVMGLTPDGSTVAFMSSSRSLVPGEVSLGYDNAFLFDRLTGNVTLASGAGSSFTVTGNNQTSAGGLSRNGAVVVFSSQASDLVADDLNNAVDVFAFTSPVAPPADPQLFYTLSPCRLADTRLPAGDWGGPTLSAGFDRSFMLVGRCGIPASAKAVSLNLTVVQPTAPGDLRLFAGGAAPLASVINYSPGQTRANSSVVFLGRGGEVTLRSDQASGHADVVVDVNGYFQ
jgi:Tol biopolymer transport system component